MHSIAAVVPLSRVRFVARPRVPAVHAFGSSHVCASLWLCRPPREFRILDLCSREGRLNLKSLIRAVEGRKGCEWLDRKPRVHRSAAAGASVAFVPPRALCAAPPRSVATIVC